MAGFLTCQYYFNGVTRKKTYWRHMCCWNCSTMRSLRPSVLEGLRRRRMVSSERKRLTGNTFIKITFCFHRRSMSESRFWTPSRAVNSAAFSVWGHTKKRSVGKAIRHSSCFCSKNYVFLEQKERQVFLICIFPVSPIWQLSNNHAGDFALTAFQKEIDLQDIVPRDGQVNCLNL